jgi:hypothetical protein
MKKGPFNGVKVEASGSNGHKVDKHPILERKSKSISDDCKRKQEAQIKPKTGIIIEVLNHLRGFSLLQFSLKGIL